MAYRVYILQSQSNGRFYCGHSNNPDRRLRQHNDSEYQSTRTTKIIPGPWTFVLKMECQSRSEALLPEKKIKKRGIQR
jgi:putative endonuclease